MNEFLINDFQLTRMRFSYLARFIFITFYFKVVQINRKNAIILCIFGSLIKKRTKNRTLFVDKTIVGMYNCFAEHKFSKSIISNIKKLEKLDIDKIRKSFLLIY